VFSLLGPNGAGKTTTVEILEGLRVPTSGDVTVLGTDISKGYSRIRKRVGVLPQNFEPFDLLSPFEAIGYWADLFEVKTDKKEIASILELVGLGERKNVMSKTLSGGEKRKLGIALSMVNSPELLFLDEPTTGLDPWARRDLWKLVEETKKRGTTVVLTTHYLDEAEKLADDVAIMHRGRIIAQGPPAQLVSKYGKKTSIVLVGAGPEGLRELSRRGISATARNGDVVVTVEGQSELRKIFAELSSIEVSYREIYTRRETLEDVFLSLIGSRMDEGVLQE
jgi:ABC-2 type transport system ATP-binding protein